MAAEKGSRRRTVMTPHRRYQCLRVTRIEVRATPSPSHIRRLPRAARTCQYTSIHPTRTAGFGPAAPGQNHPVPYRGEAGLPGEGRKSMAGGARRGRDQVADAVAYVCEHLDELSAALSPRHRTTLDALLRKLHADDDPAEELEQVHRALRTAGDARGVFGHVRSLTPPGLAVASRPIPVLLCPRAALPCSRHAWPTSEKPDTCAVSGLPLRRALIGQ